MEKISEKILNIVVEEQKKQNISTRMLAEKSNCTVRAIQYWKQGERNISLKNAEKVLETLGYELKICPKSNYEQAQEG